MSGANCRRLTIAADDVLLDITSHGIVSETFADKLRLCAKICLEGFAGDLRQVLKWPNGPPTPEQAQIVQRLVERIDYDGVQGKLTLVMRQNEPEAATELSA